jgi:hypothetical protein
VFNLSKGKGKYNLFYKKSPESVRWGQILNMSQGGEATYVHFYASVYYRGIKFINRRVYRKKRLGI